MTSSILEKKHAYLPIILWGIFLCLPFFNYILFYVFTVLFVFISQRYGFFKHIEFLISFWLVFSSSILSISIDEIIDIETYFQLFDYLGQPETSIFAYKADILFSILIKIFSSISNNVHFIHFGFVFLGFSILICFLRKVNLNYYHLAFILFFFVTGIKTAPFLIRQNLSIYFLLLSSLYIESNLLRRTFFISSVLSHVTSIIYLPLLLNSVSKVFNRKLFLVLFPISLFLFLTINIENLVAVIRYLIDKYGMIPRISYYLFNLPEYSFSFSILITAILSFFITLSMLDYDDGLSITRKMILLSCIFMISTLNIPTLHQRLGFIVYYYLPVVIYVNYDCLKKKDINSLMYILLFIYCILRILHFIFTNDSNYIEVSLSNNNVASANMINVFKSIMESIYND